MHPLESAALPRRTPISVIQVSCRERPLSDRKADIAYDEIIVRRGNRFDCPLSQAQADVRRAAPPSRLVATSGHSSNQNQPPTTSNYRDTWAPSLINGKPPYTVYKRARQRLSRLYSEQIPPPLGVGRGRKRRHPPPQGARSPHVHDAVEFTGQYIGVERLTTHCTATVSPGLDAVTFWPLA